MCLRAKAEPDRFPRYPRVPVERCPGYEAREAGAEAGARP
jgi:hypothetical protein